MQKIILFLAFASAVPQQGTAQAVNALRQGVRIEVRPVNGKPQTGTLASLRNDSLFYAPDRGASAVDFSTGATSLAFADIKSIRLSRGRNALGGALSKGLIGTGIGLLSGAILGAATYSKGDPESYCDPNSIICLGCLVICSRGEAAVFVGVLGGGIGLVAGSIYGATHGNERWTSVELPRR